MQAVGLFCFSPGAAEKAANEIGGLVVAPPFTEADARGVNDRGHATGPSDFNDWVAKHGAGSIAKVVNAMLQAELLEPAQWVNPARVLLVPSYDEALGVDHAYQCLVKLDAKLNGANTKLPVPMIVPYEDAQIECATELVRKVFPDAAIAILAAPGDEAEAQRVAAQYDATVDFPSVKGQWRGWGEYLLDLLFAHIDAAAGEDRATQDAANQALEQTQVARVQSERTKKALPKADASPALPLASPPAREVGDVHLMQTVDPFDWPNLSERMKPLNTIPNLRFLLDSYGFTVRYDVIRKDMLVTHPGQRGIRDNMRSKVIDTVISLCALNGLAKTDAPSFMMSIADDNPCNPAMDFITVKPWDGISRLADLLATVETKPGFDRELFALLMRRWLISAVAAAAKPDGFWSKGVLVFQGDQSLGKTAWFRSLLPQEMRDLVKVDAHIDPANKDTIISAVSHWLVELGELDGTLRKADIARLKGFISQDMDQFRRPYGRAEEKFQRRTVFFASVNPEHFLADDTGNVRWWTVPVTGVNS